MMNSTRICRNLQGSGQIHITHQMSAAAIAVVRRPLAVPLHRRFNVALPRSIVSIVQTKADHLFPEVTLITFKC